MTAKLCTVCRHPQRAALDEAIVAGETSRPLAKRINALTPDVKPLSHDAVNRHRRHVGKAITRALARRPDDTPDALADHLAEQMQAKAVDETRLENTLFDKMRALEDDAQRMKQKAEEDRDYRAGLVAIDKLLAIIKLQHELTPPKTTPADVQRVAEWMAVEAGVPVEDFVAECERIAQIQADIAAGRTPPHSARAGSSDIGSPNFDLRYTIKVAADAARLPETAPSVPSSAIIPGVPPPLPTTGDEPEPPALLVLGPRPWHVVI